MIQVESTQLTHLPASHMVHAALFHNVDNAAYLQQQLQAGNDDYEYAFIDGSIVISKLHVYAAVFRAVNDALAGRLKTRNVHSEIVFCLSGKNNITSSLRQHGIGAHTRTLVVLKIGALSAGSHMATHLDAVIRGDSVVFDNAELRRDTDWLRLRKIYQWGVLRPEGAGKGRSESIDEKSEFEMLVLGAIALRGNTN